MMPHQEQIDQFYELFNNGWSITYSMSKARISGKQYKSFIASDPDLKARIDEYKYNKRRTTKCTYEGRKLSYSEFESLGLKKEYQSAQDKMNSIERTKAVIESIRYIPVELPETSYSLPRGYYER